MRRRSRKYLLFVAFLLFLSSYVSSSLLFAYLRKVYFPEFFDIMRKFIFADDVSCYRTSESFTNYIYAPNSVFFYQTTCRKTIRLLEACSIEAAARVHPNQRVYIILLNNIPSTDPVIKQIEKFKNVEISRVNIDNYVIGTPFHNLYNFIKKQKRRYKIVSDLLKIITLFKYGGTVLDLDIVVTQSLNNLGDNWFLKDDGYILSTLKLSNGVIDRAAAGMIMSNLKKQVDSNYLNWEKATEAALRDLCSISNVKDMNNCSGLNIYESKILRPISYNQRHLYLEPGDFRTSYGYQTWLDNIQTIPRDSLYYTIAQNYCPFIYEKFMEGFVTDY